MIRQFSQFFVQKMKIVEAFSNALFFSKSKQAHNFPKLEKNKVPIQPHKVFGPIVRCLYIFFSLCYIVSFIWPDLAK